MEYKNLSWLASAVIILLLVIAGPAQGFVLSLSLDDDLVQQGQIIKFTASVDIEDGERLPIEYLELRLSGAENQVCKFYPNGSLGEGCKGINSITRMAELDFGYGYGYGYYDYGYGYDQGFSWGYGYGYGYGYNQGSYGGKLVYEIRLDTSSYSIGSYDTALAAVIGGNWFVEEGESFVVNAVVITGGGDDDEECETNWTCEAWGECNGVWQYRSCVLENPECSVYPERPDVARRCNIGNLGGSDEGDFEDLGGGLQDDGQEMGENRGEEGNEGVSRITGAVIGPGGATLGDLFIVIIGMVVVIGGLTTLIVLRRTRLRRRMNFYSPEFY